MSTPLFDAQFRYTEEALKLDAEMSRAIAPFFTRGYSPREIGYMLTAATQEEVCTTVLGWKDSKSDASTL